MCSNSNRPVQNNNRAVQNNVNSFYEFSIIIISMFISISKKLDIFYLLYVYA